MPGAVAVSLALAALASVPGAKAQSQAASNGIITAQASPQLFATMCALYAAGFETDASVDASNPGLAELQSQLLALQGPAAVALRKYYREHELADPTLTMSRFVTFALVVGPPPRFEYTVQHEDLPPDVLVLEGFNQILANFYKEAQLEGVWKQLDPVYEQSAANYRAPLADIVLKETGYLRELLRPGKRTFTVYIEPLAENRINVRNIGNQYAVVVSPQSDSLDEVRHAFLHFMLDPLPIRYADNVAAEEPLLKQAERAPRFPPEFHDDISGFFTECLVKAVELRLRRLPAAQLSQRIDAEEADGYVLVRPLSAALAAFESSQPPMSAYFPDLLRSINVAAETKRLETVTFPPASEETAAGEANVASDVRSDSSVGAMLSAGEQAIAAQDAQAAQAWFEHALAQSPGEPRAIYGLAVASVLQGKGDRARELFEQVVAASLQSEARLRPDPVALAWSHIYLGRMNDLAGDREAALTEYHAALSVAGAPESARAAAQRGLDEGYQPAGKSPSPG